MILPDVNLLVHAYNAEAPNHAAAKAWWERTLTAGTAVFLPWAVLLGFVRLTTSPRVAPRPARVDLACAVVERWLARPGVSVLHPGDRHAEIVFGLLRGLGTGANLTTDAHLAALALEFDLELCSTDADFARFPGLRWRDPLAAARRPRRRSAPRKS